MYCCNVETPVTAVTSDLSLRVARDPSLRFQLPAEFERGPAGAAGQPDALGVALHSNGNRARRAVLVVVEAAGILVLSNLSQQYGLFHSYRGRRTDGPDHIAII